MNASIPAALLMLLLAGGWWLGRRRSRPFLRSTDTTAVAELNRAQIERLQLLAPPPAELRDPVADPAAGSLLAASAVAFSAGGSPVALPLEPRDRRRRLRQLHAWMRGSRAQRLQALAIARLSPQRDVLPLLRLGLRDPDPAVMAAAAAAMARFRGRSAAAQPSASVVPATRRGLAQSGRAAMLRPRNVLRTR